MTDTRAIKPEDNVGGTFTQQLTIAEVTTAYVSPVPTVAPGVIVCEPGTVNEEAIHYKTKDAGAGTISGLTRDYTNLNSGTGIQHENGEDWEIYQNALYVANLVDILTEGYLREQQTVARTAATTFTVVGNVAALYTAGRVVRFNGDNTEVETIVSSSYSAGTGLTTVTVTGSIPDPLTYVEVGIQPKAAAFVQTIGDQTVAGVKTFSSSPVVPDPTTAQQAASKAYVDTYGQFSSMARQAIINGNFDVWQRGTTATNQASGEFLADRYRSFKQAGSGGAFPTNVVESRQAMTPGDLPGSFYFFRVAPDGAGTTAADQLWQRYQTIEYGNRFLCGLNKTVTVSFYARSSIANKKLGVYLEQNYGTTGSPSSTEQIVGDAFTLTSSWAKYTLTLTTNTLVGKTFGTDNNDYLNLAFAYAWGTNFGGRVGESTAETFVGSGTIDIAQVQLCAGSVALPFQPKSYEDEETACERYCQAFVADQTNGTIGAIGIAFNTAGAQLILPLRRRMRTVPTLTATASDWKIADSSSSTDVTAMALATAINSSSSVVLEVSASSITQFRPYFLIGDGTANRTLILSAEL